MKINDRDVQVSPGTLVIEATRRIGTEVPSFCYYPGLSLQAACRMCLVEVEKMPKLQTACTLVATEGMIVRTNTEQVRNARKYMLEFLLTNHPLDCPVCDKGGECELQDMVFRYGADTSRFIEEKIHRPEEKWSELVYYDAPRCILCFRCVRVCDEGMDVKALGVGMRGANSVIIPNRGDHLDCEECGMCIDICPVGALTSGTYRYKTRPWEMQYASDHLHPLFEWLQDHAEREKSRNHAFEQSRPFGYQQGFPVRQRVDSVLISPSILNASSSPCCGVAPSSILFPGKRRRRRRRRS